MVNESSLQGENHVSANDEVPPVLELEERLEHMRRLVEEQAETIKRHEREKDSLARRVAALRAELSLSGKLRGEDKADRFTESVARLADGVKNIEQARALLAEVTEHIGQSLQERDALLEYILDKAPDAPERQERERVNPVGDTGRSVIRRLRIGKREQDHLCVKCAQPSSKHCSAHLFCGFYADGRLGELFVTLGRSHRNQLAGGGFHLAAKLGSLALQHGAAPSSLVRQMRYHKDVSGGKPFSADGPMKDTPGVYSLVDYLGVTLERLLAERASSQDPEIPEWLLKPHVGLWFDRDGAHVKVVKDESDRMDSAWRGLQPEQARVMATELCSAADEAEGKVG